MVQNAVTVNVSMALRFSAQIVIATAFVFLLQWSLTLVMLSVVPAIMITGVLYARFVKSIGKLYQDRLADASTVASEALGNVRTVRSFGMESKEASRYADAVQLSYVQGRRRAVAYGAFGGVLGMLGQCAVGARRLGLPTTHAHIASRWHTPHAGRSVAAAGSQCWCYGTAAPWSSTLTTTSTRARSPPSSSTP